MPNIQFKHGFYKSSTSHFKYQIHLKRAVDKLQCTTKTPSRHVIPVIPHRQYLWHVISNTSIIFRWNEIHEGMNIARLSQGMRRKKILRGECIKPAKLLVTSHPRFRPRKSPRIHFWMKISRVLGRYCYHFRWFSKVIELIFYDLSKMDLGISSWNSRKSNYV